MPSDSAELRARAKAHLSRAASVLGDEGQAVDFAVEALERLERGNLEGAIDVLFEAGDQHGGLSRSFWDALQYACENLGFDEPAKLCSFRWVEARDGYIEASLTLFREEQGGRRFPIFSDYRPSWNIGNRTEDDRMEINDARVTLEDCAAVAPGGTAVVRLHPLWLDGWRNVRIGDEIDMHEGSRVVGHAVVTSVRLKAAGGT